MARKSVALTEHHNIVYRAAPPGRRHAHRRRLRTCPWAWQRPIVPDDVLLFRYSALTFNGHRIHYDRKYVTEVEGYPGLIVHGPLIATLLMDLLRRQSLTPSCPL
jgi:3-methylfumaryl-CoA hydratase